MTSLNTVDDPAEQIQLITLNPKWHNPPPKKVVSHRKQTLTPDIVWSDPVPRCFLYSCAGIMLFICILVVHDVIHPTYSSPSRDISLNHHHANSLEGDTQPSSPHVLWFILDDLGQSDFSYGGAEFDTPNIDYLARNGIELSQHYVAPLCSATRSSLLTGTFAYKMGLQGVMMDYIHPSTISHIPSKYETVGNYFQSAGYHTALYGKWHVGYSKASYTPTHRGFDSHIGQYQYAIDPFSKQNLDAWQSGKDWFVDGQFVDDQDYSSQILLEAILKDLDEYDGTAKNAKPLFMYISFVNPHFPVVTPDEFNAEYSPQCEHIANEQRQKYCLSVLYLDMAIGAITTKLQDVGMYENSLIALSGDNGPQLLNLCGNPGQHVAAGSAYPYRGGKYTLFQGGVQTPAFIAGGAIESKYKGTSTNHVFSAVDWLPTLLHFTTFYEDGNVLDSDLVDGIDLYDEIFGSESANGLDDAVYFGKHRRFLILSMEYENEKYINTAIIYKKHKLMVNNQLAFFPTKDSNIGETCNVRSVNPLTAEMFDSEIVDDGHNVPDLMLFDLESDPNEHDDLLQGLGTAHDLFNDEEDETKILVSQMMTILNHERNHNIDELRPQYFEGFYADDNGFFVEPTDEHTVDGVHRPWQSEDEDEFPEGYHY